MNHCHVTPWGIDSSSLRLTLDNFILVLSLHEILSWCKESRIDIESSTLTVPVSFLLIVQDVLNTSLGPKSKALSPQGVFHANYAIACREFQTDFLAYLWFTSDSFRMNCNFTHTIRCCKKSHEPPSGDKAYRSARNIHADLHSTLPTFLNGG